jgi:hypothetical protein
MVMGKPRSDNRADDNTSQVPKAPKKRQPLIFATNEADYNSLWKLGVGHLLWADEPSNMPTFAGADVILVPPGDPVRAEAYAKALAGHVRRLQILRLPDLPEGGVVADWVKRGGSAKKFKELVSELDGVADHVVAIHGLIKRIAGSVVEIGRRLTEIRKQTDHGEWIDLLDREFKWTDQTARNYMNAYDRFGSNPKRVLDLELANRTLYLLAAPSTPQEAVDEVIAAAEAGEKPSHDEAQAIVHKARGGKPIKKKAKSKKVAAGTLPPSKPAVTTQAAPIDTMATAVSGNDVDPAASAEARKVDAADTSEPASQPENFDRNDPSTWCIPYRLEVAKQALCGVRDDLDEIRTDLLGELLAPDRRKRFDELHAQAQQALLETRSLIDDELAERSVAADAAST